MRNHRLPKHAANGRRIEPIDLAKAADATQVLEVGIAVQPIPTDRAYGPDEPLALPQPERRCRDPHPACRLADQVAHAPATACLASAARRWLHSWTAMKTMATRKMRVPRTLTSGGMPTRLAPNTHSGKVTVRPALNSVMT